MEMRADLSLTICATVDQSEAMCLLALETELGVFAVRRACSARCDQRTIESSSAVDETRVARGNELREICSEDILHNLCIGSVILPGLRQYSPL